MHFKQLKWFHIAGFVFAVGLMVGGGYAGWRHFFGVISEEELREYAPVAFEVTGFKRCRIHKPGFLDFSPYKSRYFVVDDEERWNNINKELGYREISFEEGFFERNINFDDEILVGGVHPYTGSYKYLIKPIIKEIYKKDNNVMVLLGTALESYLGAAPRGEGFSPPYRRCKYQMARIRKSDIGFSENNFLFVLDDEKIIIQEKQL